MSYLNDLLREFAIHSGIGWAVCGLLAFLNLIVMYALDSPRSLGGRIARTLGYMAMICGAFGWRWHALGAIALPLLFGSYLALNIQYWYECRVRKQRMPVAPPVDGSRVERLATVIVRNRDDLPPLPKRASAP